MNIPDKNDFVFQWNWYVEYVLSNINIIYIYIDKTAGAIFDGNIYVRWWKRGKWTALYGLVNENLGLSYFEWGFSILNSRAGGKVQWRVRRLRWCRFWRCFVRWGMAGRPGRTHCEWSYIFCVDRNVEIWFMERGILSWWRRRRRRSGWIRWSEGWRCLLGACIGRVCRWWVRAVCLFWHISM